MLEKLSNLTGLSLSYLSKVDRSDRVPPIATLQTLATVLGFDMAELLHPQTEKAEGDADIMTLRREHHISEDDESGGYSMTRLTAALLNWLQKSS